MGFNSAFKVLMKQFLRETQTIFSLLQVYLVILLYFYYRSYSWYSDWATGCRVRGSLPEIALYFLPKVHIVSVTQPAKYSIANWGLFLGVKRPVRENGFSPPSTVKIKNVQSYSFTSPICFCKVCRKNFNFVSFLTFVQILCT